MNVDVYEYGSLQDFRAMLITAAADGITDIAMLQAVVDDAIRRRRLGARSAKRRRSMPTGPRVECPVCGAPANVEQVNVSKCTRVGHGYRYALTCVNSSCRWTAMSRLSVVEITAGNKDW